MTLVTDTWTDPGADGTLVPDTGSITLQTVVAAANQTTDPRMVTTKPITCFLDEDGRTVFEVVDSFDPGWALDGPMPYKVTRNLGSGRRVYAVIITGTETHLRDLEPIEDVDVAPYPVPGDKGDQGEVAVHSTVTGSPGSPALVEDLDPSIHKALLKFTIPEGVKGDQGEVEVGTTTTLDAGSAATVTDSDPSPNRAVLDFGIPQGTLVEVDSTATGDAGTPAVVEDVDPSPNRAALKFTIPQGTEVQVGATITGAPGTQASVTDLDPSPNRALLDFTVPRGDKGDKGEVAVDSTVTGAPGTPALVEDLDASPHKALLRFTVPEGLPGAAATVDAGATITGAPGTLAQVVNSGDTTAAVFDFTIPRGDPGAQGPPGVSGAAAFNYRMSALADADVDPGSGNITIETTGGQNRRLAISKTDADGNPRNAGVLLPGSGLTLVYDADSAPPANAISVYVVSQVPQDMGTWVKVETLRTQMFGTPQVPPAAAAVQVVMELGAGEFYLTEDAADLRYESKSELLKEAVWWVDAAAASTTQLEDLTGNNRPAVFGAGAAAPVVLPWDGEDYLHIPYRTDAASDTINASAPGVWDVAVATIRGSFQAKPINTQLVQVNSGSVEGFTIALLVNGQLRSHRYGATTPAVDFGLAPTKEWNRFTHTASSGVTLWEHSDDGTVWTAVGSVNHGTCPPGANRNVGLGMGSAAHAAAGRRYSVTVALDGSIVHILDPRNVSADYTTIANTGSAGGNWTIVRAATGYKTAVVDRPLLLFGGGQTLAASGSVEGGGTRLRSRRAFGSGGTIGTVETVHATGAPEVSGVTEEYLAEAVFSRVLTAAEIAQVSQELAGVPHSQQNAPHLTHPPLIAGTTAAALPTTAREGSIVVLADNTIAIRTRTGGWRALTTTALAGSPP